MVTEDERRLFGLLGQLVPEPRELLGRECARVASTARLVITVETEDSQPAQLTREVRRLVAREEVIVKAVVPLPLANAARGVRVADVRAVVVAACHEVIAAVLAESVEQMSGFAEIDRDRFGRD